MAKWGQGDPRWIVEERPDATNVNNWHWVEKDATNWSRDKFKELFVGMRIEDEKGYCEILDLTQTDGEASANNRKAKLIFFYEWVIAGTWQGKLFNGQKEIKGKFEIPNLSEENDPQDIEVVVTTEKQTDEAYALKELMRIKGTEAIQEKVAKYITDLKEEYSQGIILPSADKVSSSFKASTRENVMKEELNKIVESAPQPSSGVSIHTSTLTVQEKFRCSAADLYRALTDKMMVQAYAGSDIIMEPANGERFVLMGGNIIGEFTELVPDKKVIMRWRMKSWPAEHYSNVTIDLEEKEDVTHLSLKQTGVPDKEVDRTQEGWKLNYWERMRHIFGFGAQLF